MMTCRVVAHRALRRVFLAIRRRLVRKLQHQEHPGLQASLLLPLPFAPTNTFTCPSSTVTDSSDLNDSTVSFVIISFARAYLPGKREASEKVLSFTASDSITLLLHQTPRRRLER